MTWAKLDDRAWLNEKLLSLSHEAYRLWTAALSLVAEGWPASEGCLTRARAEFLAQCHHIADPARAIDELVAKRCWEKRPHGLLHVHDIENFLPDAELSAARAAAGRRGGKASQRNRSTQASASDLLEQDSSTPRARVPTRPDPSRPDQLTTLTDVRVARPPSVMDSENRSKDVQAIVGAFVDACREAGSPIVSDSKRARVGIQVKALRADGHDNEALLAGVRELARRNASPALLEDIVGDIERVRAGTPIGRAVAAPITENPVTARIRAIRGDDRHSPEAEAVYEELQRSRSAPSIADEYRRRRDAASGPQRIGAVPDEATLEMARRASRGQLHVDQETADG